MTTFNEAYAAHTAGRLDDAERGYRAFLAQEPQHADAWHLLGIVAQQRGNLTEAVDLIKRAVKWGGPQADFLANLGIILDAIGRHSEAVDALEQAAKLEIGSAQILFALGNGLRSLGRLTEAEERYRQAIALQPADASAHNNLGSTLQDLGRAAEAEAAYREALKREPRHARAHYNLGIVLKDSGRREEATASFREAVALVPDFIEAHINLGVLLQDQAQLELAVAYARKAAAAHPQNQTIRASLALALAELGMLHKRQRRYAPAVEALQMALAERPDDVVTLNNLANTLIEDGRPVEAEAYLRKALTYAPSLPESHFHLGNALKAQDRFEEAAKTYEIALNLRPGFTKARINLGGVLQKQGQYERALAAYDAADVESGEIMSARGVMLEALGRHEEALASFQRARTLKPDLAEAHRNAGVALLMQGDYQGGWEAYEWRWKCEGVEGGWRGFPFPLWQGERGDGAVLLWGEQGVGDKVLYAGMIPDLMAQGHAVVMETDTRLITLFERSFPGLKAVAKATPPDPATQRGDIRWYTPLAGIGRWLRPNADSFPTRAIYLTPDPVRRARYRKELEAINGAGPIVGISWASSNPKIGRHKTLDLRQWAPLLQIPGVRFVDLQYGDTSAERAAVEKELGVSITHIEGLDLREDIDGVAALAAACDLVISVSSTIVHLAAALGVPTWVLVPASAGSLWYWGRGANHTPWYPSATIFRQAKLGEWTETLHDVGARLEKFTA